LGCGAPKSSLKTRKNKKKENRCLNMFHLVIMIIKNHNSGLPKKRVAALGRKIKLELFSILSIPQNHTVLHLSDSILKNYV